MRDNLKPSLTLACSYLLIIILGIFLTLGSFAPLRFLAVGAAEVGQIILGFLSGFSQYPLFNNLVLVLFWGTVGLICYWIYLRLANALIWAQNQAAIEVGFTNHGRRSHWVQVYIWPPAAFLVLLIALFVTWRYSWQWWHGLWSGFWQAPVSPGGLTKLIVGTAGAFANLHLLALATMGGQLKKPR